MKKTNIRINDYFLIKKNDQYFLSDITDQEQWINTDNLVNHKGKNVTSKLGELIKQHNLDYNVNFITEQTGGWGGGQLYRNVQTGGWPPSSILSRNTQTGGSGWVMDKIN